MTTDLATLLADRTAALAAPRREKPWCRLSPAEVAVERALIERREAAEAAIVAFLRSRPAPVAVGDVVLHLTADRMHFVEIDRATGWPVYVRPKVYGWRSLLHRYPNAGRTNAPALVP
jgi:hypothetical protein